VNACGSFFQYCIRTDGISDNPTETVESVTTTGSSPAVQVVTTPSPQVAPLGEGCGGGCNKCIAIPGNADNTNDEQCAPCATGQTWHPCNEPGLCQCASGSPEPEPEPEPSTPAPSPAPTAAQIAGTDEKCAGAHNGPCSACLASDNVCHAVDKPWCDARASIGFLWCGELALVETRWAKTRKQAFLGTALLQMSAPLSRISPRDEF